MTKETCTKGPWKLSHTHEIVQDKRSIDGCCEIICQMAFCTGPDRPRNMNEANAALISAAPDMHTALEKAERILFDIGKAHDEGDDVTGLIDYIPAIINAALVALEKAKPVTHRRA